MSQIYVPGQGMVNAAHRRVNRLVNAYDERLFAATNPQTGWDTVFVKMPPSEDGMDIAGQRALPIMAFPTGFPGDDEIQEKIVKADALRRGREILDEIHRHNERIEADNRYRVEQAEGEMAEVVESFRHDQGLTPYRRVLRPNLKTGVRR